MKYALLLVPAFLIGCGTDCDKAGDQITAKYDECGIDTTATGGEAEDVDCTDELGTQSLCIAACVDAADCTVLAGTATDTALMTDYSDCAVACV